MARQNGAWGQGVAVHAVLRWLTIGGVTAVLMAAAVSAQQGRFRSGVDLVNVGVMVLDKRGNFITDLSARDFEVYEEGERQTVSHFSRGGTAAEAENLRLGLLFDTSGSMQDDIELARTAAIKFLKGLPEAQDITLVDFDTEVRIARYGQADFPRLIERIRGRRPEGLTALYDALGVYLDGLTELEGRKVLVIYTDGGDTRSAVTFADTLGMLRMADVTVYAIGFLEHQVGSMRSQQKMQLMQMAETTGGQAFFPVSTRNLTDIFDKVVAQIRAQYSLGFTSRNARKDGTWRKIEVRLVGSHLQGLKVRSRKGYFAPLLESASRGSGQ
jgi:Ca-activated chloride channel family protein